MVFVFIYVCDRCAGVYWSSKKTGMKGTLTMIKTRKIAIHLSTKTALYTVMSEISPDDTNYIHYIHIDDNRNGAKTNPV